MTNDTPTKNSFSSVSLFANFYYVFIFFLIFYVSIQKTGKVFKYH